MFKILFFLFLVLPLSIAAQSQTSVELHKWKTESENVKIIRDNWGIPHIYGKTDADAVFGLIYAQCEDDFKRVEMNYIEKLGRISELKGISHLYNDLQNKILIDTAAAISDYKTAPDWLKKLLHAFADAVNYYIYVNPQEKPALLHHFEPWYPLLWTDGSIGAINTAGISPAELEKFYTGRDIGFQPNLPFQEDNATGSNGFAIAPSNTTNGNALLYINPHVSFYFRPEVHMVSEEGLNAYGAVTWGQFFIYQGFNEFCGWMHTSSEADVADLYEEKVNQHNNGYVYLYENAYKKIKEEKKSIYYADKDGMHTKYFTVYATHHGPVLASRNGKWISLAANNRNMNGLIQSWQRTKAKSFDDYKKAMDLLANSSNNTVYADASGNIAYWHGNFIPKRNLNYDWSKPVDGTLAETEWQGLHTVNESVHVYNPSNGWLQNCNSTPFTVAGKNSPDKKDYPVYMAPDAENFRGIHAVKILKEEKHFTIDKLIVAGYDTYITAFEELIPALVKAFENLPENSEQYNKISSQVKILKEWDLRCNENSIATTLAIEWGYRLLPMMYADTTIPQKDLVKKFKKFSATAKPDQLIQPLIDVINRLVLDHGKWEIPWGDINRFQRLSDSTDLFYDDHEPSLPVPFVSSVWGMLPSYSASYFPNTKKRYGVHGNSFICAVEFGKKIKAKSLLAGGESGHLSSVHFYDQALMYSKGIFKDVLFYKEDVLKNASRIYNPGK